MASTGLVAQAAPEEVIFQGKRTAEQEQGPSEAGGSFFHHRLANLMRKPLN